MNDVMTLTLQCIISNTIPDISQINLVDSTLKNVWDEAERNQDKQASKIMETRFREKVLRIIIGVQIKNFSKNGHKPLRMT